MNADQTPVQTQHARLLRSMLTGRYLLFGSAEPDDPLIYVRFPVPNDNVEVGHYDTQIHGPRVQSDDSENVTTA